ncbi:MAG: M20/M25/M40 family metallo-hydrolase, partial [Fimbriimonadaceae bacterium]|nr:M20/M25/M40 family metallo-hydrolase [Fimbriimonadaceae bacterium]
HFDTVEPTAGLEIEEVDGVFRSKSDTILGADDKAGMAPIIEAVRVIQEQDLPHGDIVLLLTVAEEIGLKGAGALQIEDLNLDYGYVLDTGPPVGSFVTRTAFHDKIDFTVIGRPAHAGKHPEEGINAICVAADAISRFKVGRIDDETTSNLGIIAGGTGVNIVCPSVTVKAEARSTTVESLDRVLDTMIKSFEEVCRAWGAELKVEHNRHYGAYDIDPQSEVVQVAQRAARSMGFDGALRTTLGGSDANQFNAKGVPSIVVATGMSEIHTHDEYVSRVDLIKTTELVLAIVAESVKSRA